MNELDIFVEELGRQYKPIRKLGEDSFGVIFLCERFASKNPLAVKIISKHSFREEEWYCSRYLRKKSPFLMEIYEKFEHKDYVFLEMEYGNNSSLHKALKYVIPGAVTTRLLFQLLTGVHTMHKNHIIHRDLKPNNIILHKIEANGNRPEKIYIKITGFELAREICPDSLASTICGTIPFMPPEVLEYTDYDEKFDIWSCGIVFYNIFTNGQFPFPTQSAFQVLQNQKKPIMRPTATRFPVDDDSWDLLQRMLATDPKQRISAADALRAPFFTHRWRWVAAEAQEQRRYEGEEEERSSGQRGAGVYAGARAEARSGGCAIGCAVGPIAIRVDAPYDVQNGLLGAKRDVVLRLCAWMSGRDTNIRTVMGMCFEHFQWKNHRFFVRNRAGEENWIKSMMKELSKLAV